MPDDVIRLTVPPDADLTAVASIAVRAAARQVALPEQEIERLRDELEGAFAALVATDGDGPVSIELRTGPGRLSITIGTTTIESR